MLKSVDDILNEMNSKMMKGLPSDGIKSAWKSKNTPFWFEKHSDGWYASISDWDVFENNIYPEFNNPIVPHKTLELAIEYAQMFLFSKNDMTSVRPLFRSMAKKYKIKGSRLYVAREPQEGKWFFGLSSTMKFTHSNFSDIQKKLQSEDIITKPPDYMIPMLFSSRKTAIDYLITTIQKHNWEQDFLWLLK